MAILPDYPASSGSSDQTTVYIVSTAASKLNRTARNATETQATVAGTNTLIPLVYGRQRLGGHIGALTVSLNQLVALVVWCLGEIDAVESVYINDEVPVGSVSVTSYTGTAGQTASSVMATHFPGYTDALAGIAYSVFVIPSSAVSGFPRFAAVVRGKKIATSSGGTPTYSTNPAYILADFIESTTYGLGKSVDWTSVGDVATVCDELIGSPSEKRRSLSIVFDQPVAGEDILQTLRDYAGCFVVPEGSSYRLVPDAPAASVATFDASNIVSGSVKLSRRAASQQPTMVEVQWTDTTVTPWATKRYTTPAATPRRMSRISKPGITRYGEAVRYATMRLNEATLCDLSIEFAAFDEGLKLQIGDVITVSHPLGLTSKKFRVAKIAAVAPGGRWQISGVEYDAAKYSDAIATAPSSPDTTLVSPSSPPALASLTATEQTYALANGTFASRAIISWTTPTNFPFVRYVNVTVRLGSTVVARGLVDYVDTSWATPALQEGVAYTVTAGIISTSGAAGPEISTLVTLAGKSIAPGNVGAISGFEAGGRVFLSWTRADNPTLPGTPDPDVWRYEIRRGATTDAWSAAKVIDQVDALTYVDEGAPAGTWRYQVKAIDSVKQYSATAATLDVTVTTDAVAFLVDTYDQTSPTLTNMSAFTLGGSTYWITEDGTAFGTAFPNNLSTYTSVLATYHTSCTSTWLGESEDFGSELGGQWTGIATVSDVSGSHTSYLGYSTNGTSWTYASGLSQKLNARFARMKHESLTTSTLLVASPTQQIRLDAIPREETGTGTSSASGATTITLANDYVSCKKLTVTPEGTTAAMALYDNIVLGNPTTFDVYVFDTSGTKIARAFRYAWQGV